MTAMNSMQISEADVKRYLSDAQSYLDSARQTIALDMPKIGTYIGGQSKQDEVSFSRFVTGLDTADPLLSSSRLSVLRAVRRGMQVGFAVAELYRKQSGAASFESAAGLSDDQKTEFNEKMQTAGAITLFVLARYVRFELQALTQNNSFVGNIPVTFDQMEFATPRSGVMCTMYHLTRQVEVATQSSDDRLIATTLAFMELVTAEIRQRVTGLKHIESFTNVSYTLEATEFSVHGFDDVAYGAAVSVAFNRVSREQIVGNQDAKHFVRRFAQRMLAYNRKEQKNVFTELGGLAPVWMGYGPPGTGKSMVIAMTATELQDGCDRIGMPFLFHPLPDNIIDSYQGNSAKNMVTWMKAAQDPNKIVFMPIDDAENILEERTRQGVSEGVRAAIGVFLRYTEGAYAVNRGNSSIGVFTNLPEQIDSAVRSRIQARMVMNGAVTVEDALDQDYIWMRKFASQEGFMNLIPPAYQYMSAQHELRSMADAAQTRDVPGHATVAEIYASVVNTIDPMHHEFIATLYMRFKDRFKMFTSRDMRNIQSAVDQRVMDFDLPDEWFETPEAFSLLEYDRQKTMVLSLRDENMKGLRFADVYRQEAIRYLDNYATIADAQFDRDVEARVKEMEVRLAVERRLKVTP